MTVGSRPDGTVSIDGLKGAEHWQRREEIATLVFERVPEVPNYVVARQLADTILRVSEEFNVRAPRT